MASNPSSGPGRAPIPGLALGLILTAVAVPATAAQLPAPDPAAPGTGAASPALARGYGAVAVNPAALGAPDRPDLSATVLSVGLASGLDPVTLGDLADWEGRDVPRRV
ncbi:MAG TPA: hypothetical protein VLL48_07850, partial [Longimicrobiales bacterium]|nr:hypothetical protein [Longimicrobiales bacterium]